MNAQLQRRALHLAIIPCHSNTHIELFILDVYLWFLYVLNVKHRNTNKPANTLYYPLTQRQISLYVAHVCVCCEHALENCGFVCVMLVNAQLQHKAIKRSISGHVKN